MLEIRNHSEDEDQDDDNDSCSSASSSLGDDELSQLSMDDYYFESLDHHPPLRMDAFCNNHVLVNRARRSAGDLQPLTRSRRLDALARVHADTCARQRRVGPLARHSEELRLRMGRGNTVTVVGENVQRGTSVRQMHAATMKGEVDDARQKQDCCGGGRANILSPAFDEFGMATAKDKDGKLYLVQLFCSLPKNQVADGWTWCGSLVVAPTTSSHTSNSNKGVMA